jgi:hypothetical protein
MMGFEVGRITGDLIRGGNRAGAHIALRPWVARLHLGFSNQVGRFGGFAESLVMHIAVMKELPPA